MATIRITTSQNIDIDYEVAGLGERILARLIDIAIFLVILFAGIFIISGLSLLSDSGIGIIILVSIYVTLFVFYDLICEIFMNGQSVGKRMMKIKVISLDGGRPTVSQYLMRWLFRIIDFAIGGGVCAIVCVAVTEKHQRLGDIVAGTTLVRTESRTHIDNVVFVPETDNYEPVFKEAGTLSESDITLIQDVINTYVKTRNAYVVQNMAIRIRNHLSVNQPAEMNDMKFLQTIIKDYSHIVAQAESL